MADTPGDLIEIEVVYALPHSQTVVTLRVPAGTSIQEAIARSGIAAQHPEIDRASMLTGICGRRAPPSTVLSEHDRVEIYRPLIADPKLARGQRARRPAKARR